MAPAIKICGLKTVDAVKAASGADYIGFIFFPRSPRNITPKDAAALHKYAKAKVVAVVVDASDELLQEIVSKLKPDYLQLHGDESSARVAEIKKTYGLPVIKALKILTAKDLEKAASYEDVADMLMFDAKSPGLLPGGNGIHFDWDMLHGKTFKKPYFLSGGLNINNVEKALQASGAKMIDISSGLETSPGNKDPKMIADFIKKCKTL